MTPYYKVILALFTIVACTSMASTPLPLCTEGDEDDCTRCYDVLASQVVMSARNRYKLQRAFFPPEQENPVFLEVIYKYDVNTTNGPIIESLNNDSEVWFWTDSPYYLYQPIDVIQFTSLFFADYSLRRSSVTLHLRQDCRNAPEEHFLLFTQRLKLYTMKRTISAEIDDMYIPKAASVGTLKSFHESYPSMHVSRLTFAYQFVVPIVGFIALFIFWFYFWEARSSPSRRQKLTTGSIDDGNLWTLQRHSANITILSVLIASAIFCLYVIALDVAAIYSAYNTVDDSVKKYYNSDTDNINFSLEFGIVILICVEDCIVLFFMFLAFSFIACTSICYHNLPDAFKYSWSWSVYFPLGPVTCVVIHAYHILIGFIQAPYHAGSVLIFYGIITLGFVYSYKACYSAFAYCYFSRNTNDSIDKKYKCDVCLFFVFIIISVIFSLLLVFVVAIFVLVPIDNAIDDTPARLLSIERTVVILLALTLTYKVYSNRSHTLLTYIVKAKNKDGNNNREWQRLENEEKRVQVGKMFLDKLTVV